MEFYDLVRKKAVCAMCAVDVSNGDTQNSGSLVPLHEIYSVARRRAKDKDPAIENREENIKNEKIKINNKKKELKD